MKDSNVLIAEFMGLETPDGCYFEHLTEEGNRELTHHMLLQYHTSWDWLMPVVEEIDHLQYEDVVEIEEGMKMRSISATYNAVVEFIKQHNKKA